MQLDPGASRPLSLRLMGGCRLLHPVHGDVALPNRKACGLLSYLALSQSGSETRERLAGLFWSDSPEAQARTSLRQCLKQLSGVLEEVGFDGLLRDRHSIGIDQAAIAVDVRQFALDLASGVVPDDSISPETAPDRLLYGFENLDASFAAWLHVTRQGWHDRLVNLLGAILARSDVRADQVYRAASVMVQIDPTNEEGQRALIRYHAERGNVGAALKQYNALWQLLGDEYDMEPTPETQSLIAAVKLGDVAPPAAPVEPSPADVPAALVGSGRETNLPVIVVRPFMRGGPEQDSRHLVDFFRRDLIAALVRFREWIVIEAPDAGTTGADRHGDAAAIRYELEGAYVDDGAGIRLIITLKDAISHQYVWSEQLRVTQDRWFVAQQEVVRKLALSLNHSMSAERLARCARLPGLPQEIVDRWLKGHDLTLVWSHENEVQAEEIFRDIIRDAPSFSRAFSSLTTLCNTRHLRNPGVFRDPELEAEALRLAQVSVNLDPLDTRNQMALAWSYLMHRRFDQAELHFDLTYELNPNNPTTLVPCAHGLNYCGQHKRALELAEVAVQLNNMLPRFHWGYIMCIRFFAGDFAGCVSAGEQAGDVITDLYGWRAAALAHLGEVAEARAVAELFVALVRRRWRGTAPASSANITDWFLRCFPIRRPEDFALLRDGLCKAGLPADATCQPA